MTMLGPPPGLTPSILETIYRVQDAFHAKSYDEAEQLTQEILARGFADASTYHTLGTLAMRQGRLDEALGHYRQALEVNPQYRRSQDQVILLTDLHPDTTPAMAQHERTIWWQRYGATAYATRRPLSNDRDPDRPLRVGYVSGDMHRHSAAQVFGPILLQHSAAVEPYYYSSTPGRVRDDVTARYQQRPGWCDVADWSDDRLLRQIRVDEIDVLVDLAGYTPHNRLRVFAATPAQIQITAWGYATGLGWPVAMDYLVSDETVIPPDRQGEHRERIAYLPCVLTYEGPDGGPSAPLPCLTQPPTFGVFQRSMKVNAAGLALWRTILERLPESQLVIKGDFPATVGEGFRQSFGPVQDRVTVLGVTSQVDHLRAYHAIDLSLDPFPQTGGVTTCEALSMGVPCITLIGPRVIQRASASILTILGLTDFMATTPDEYVTRAIHWVTTRRDELAALRPQLRDRLNASPIVAGYVGAVEGMYRRVWQDWCAA